MARLDWDRQGWDNKLQEQGWESEWSSGGGRDPFRADPYERAPRFDDEPRKRADPTVVRRKRTHGSNWADCPDCGARMRARNVDGHRAKRCRAARDRNAAAASSGATPAREIQGSNAASEWACCSDCGSRVRPGNLNEHRSRRCQGRSPAGISKVEKAAARTRLPMKKAELDRPTGPESAQVRTERRRRTVDDDIWDRIVGRDHTD